MTYPLDTRLYFERKGCIEKSYMMIFMTRLLQRQKQLKAM